MIVQLATIYKIPSGIGVADHLGQGGGRSIQIDLRTAELCDFVEEKRRFSLSETVCSNDVDSESYSTSTVRCRHVHLLVRR